MKRVAKVTGHALCYLVLECPFCGASTTENTAMPWCVNCRVEYYVARGALCGTLGPTKPPAGIPPGRGARAKAPG